MHLVACAMAVFLINNCKFNGCGLTFPTLRELILHIEDTHIDSDPRLLEKQELQQPSCLPVSYVLRVFTEASRVESLGVIRKRQRTLSPASSICSNTPTGSEMDEDELSSESDDSNDSWTTQNEFISDFIMSSKRDVSGIIPSLFDRHRMMSSAGSTEEKPFACPVPGCKKRYKNVNGIKYHAKNGHKKEAKLGATAWSPSYKTIKKAHRCHCGKSYKTTQGLRAHSLSQHSSDSQLARCPTDFASALSSSSGHLMAPPSIHSGSSPLPAVISPTLQQHLLSPLGIRPGITSSFASVSAEG
ncbi:hypothetical protein V5799_034161 [Amblyomma americanum]|uniref:C2H2-type domain-containing protein n=2 Tax=Amblyomma americanum TaxID=6943 RepID=A0AAQ4DL88_AMBAM